VERCGIGHVYGKLSNGNRQRPHPQRYQQQHRRGQRSPTDGDYNQTLTWTSSNTNVATVNSSGLVTAGSQEGTANITATTTDGSNIIATCNVNSIIYGDVNGNGASINEISFSSRYFLISCSMYKRYNKSIPI
jgi:hypothetical protein